MQKAFQVAYKIFLRYAVVLIYATRIFWRSQNIQKIVSSFCRTARNDDKGNLKTILHCRYPDLRHPTTFRLLW